MKKSELRQIIKEEINKTIKESNLSVEENEIIENFIEDTESLMTEIKIIIKEARYIQTNGESEQLSFESLINRFLDLLRGYH